MNGDAVYLSCPSSDHGWDVLNDSGVHFCHFDPNDLDGLDDLRGGGRYGQSDHFARRALHVLVDLRDDVLVADGLRDEVLNARAHLSRNVFWSAHAQAPPIQPALLTHHHRYRQIDPL